MKKLRWQLLIVLVALVAIGILLFGQQSQLEIVNPLPIDEPQSGGEYSEALIGQLRRLNPVLDYYNQVDRDVDRLIFSSLIKFDHRGLPQGDLAETWGISQNGETYNFSIRPDAVWHDGEPVTSYDVIFTVELMRDEEIPLPEDLREFWNGVDVKDLDEKTLQFILPEPFTPFLDYLAFGILPEHILGGLSAEEIIDHPFNLQPIGSGPFLFEAITSNNGEIESIKLGGFPNYYGKIPFLETVIFKYFPDSGSALQAYQNGDVMGIGEISINILPQALKEPQLDLYSSRLPRIVMVFLNLDSPGAPFMSDPEIRRALMLGLNRRWVADRIMGGQAIIAHSPIFPESWAYYDGITQIEYDPQAAIELLKKIGYTIPSEGGQVRSKEGVALSFEMVYPESELYASIADQISQDWKKIGVEVTTVPVPIDELIEENLDSRDYEAALVEINLARSPDPDPYPFWHQAQITQGQNYSKWDDRQVSEYLERARVTLDFDERVRLYRNFQVRFGSDLPALLLFYPVYTYGIDFQVRGVSIGPLYDPSDRFNSIVDWYLYTGPVDIDTPPVEVMPTQTP